MAPSRTATSRTPGVRFCRSPSAQLLIRVLRVTGFMRSPKGVSGLRPVRCSTSPSVRVGPTRGCGESCAPHAACRVRALASCDLSAACGGVLEAVGYCVTGSGVTRCRRAGPNVEEDGRQLRAPRSSFPVGGDVVPSQHVWSGYSTPPVTDRAGRRSLRPLNSRLITRGVAIRLRFLRRTATTSPRYSRPWACDGSHIPRDGIGCDAGKSQKRPRDSERLQSLAQLGVFCCVEYASWR